METLLLLACAGAGVAIYMRIVRPILLHVAPRLIGARPC